ncbi:MAG: FecR domain-containing protein [Nannocystaceae bacterium]|nr:FecR domain-containing protein [bacterium]
MTDERPDPAEIEAAWTTPEPSPGLADRVLATHFGEPQPVEPSPRLRPWMWAVAAVVVAVLGVGLMLRGGGTVEDELRARQIETIALGDRATAVAQPGAHLAWSVQSDGTTRIDQSSGRVFYRVDHGERFDVVTPQGTVTVTGTCFSVDLERSKMKSTNIRGGALGAALASALVVAVYEGGVVLANEHGSVDVGPGQAARVADARAPVRFDPDGDEYRDDEAATKKNETSKPGQLAGDPMAHIKRQERDLDRIREEKDAQAARIRELEEQVLALGGSVDPKSPEAKKARAKMCASQSRGGACPFLEPDQETLLEMARCGTIKIDSLGFLDNVEAPVPGEYSDRLGISDPAESKKLDAAIAQQYEDYNGKLREIYLELGGDEETAEYASGSTLQSFIFDQLDRETFGDIQRAIAEERAGLREPPQDPTSMALEERVARMMAEDGNDFERLVGEQLGPERARELRRKHDGWPGSTSVHSSDCRDPQ